MTVTSSFQFGFLLFLSLLWLLWLGLSRSGESGLASLVPDLRGCAVSFSPLSVVFAVGLSRVMAQLSWSLSHFSSPSLGWLLLPASSLSHSCDSVIIPSPQGHSCGSLSSLCSVSWYLVIAEACLFLFRQNVPVSPPSFFPFCLWWVCPCADLSYSCSSLKEPPTSLLGSLSPLMRPVC